ncbi:GntR family transcriptional regulator [Acuticoccus kandeliae]|uniref:GntR family transcriptional regulator n=1 Tax=Acuticoccus kandeliae TaxID=2073160 RepID=UPI000D3E63FD|nr:GntR family transcriptional regulator [Acuticoccus kandeliae]
MVSAINAHDLVSEAHETLRAWVLTGVLPMGARLNVVQLARALNSSRTPVREALSRLTAEGFATFVPNRGHFVAVYTAARVAEIYSCRAILESEATRLAARAPLEAETAARLAEILDTIDGLIAGGCDEEAREALAHLNHEFHEAIYARCGNQELQRLIAQVTTIPSAIRHYFRFSPEQLSDSNRAHRTILRAILDGDGDRAAAAMREHIWAARDRMLPPDEIEAPHDGPPDPFATLPMLPIATAATTQDHPIRARRAKGSHR